MARPAKEAACPSPLPPALLRWAERAGPDARRLASRAGLDPGVAERDEADVTASALAGMLDEAARAAFDPHLALHLFDALPFRRHDAVAIAVRAAPTPRDVLAVTARLAPLVFPDLAGSVHDGDEIVFRARVAGHPRGLGLHVDEIVLSRAWGACRRAGDVRARRVWLTCARPRDLSPIARAFGTEDVAFGAEDLGLSLARGDADRPIASADPLLSATAEELAEKALSALPRKGAIADAIAARVESTLAERPTMDGVARALRMSARTLQRRLDAEGTRFSDVVDAARERLARRLVADRAIPLGEVAVRTGFCDLATFSRAFKRWTGVPPGAYRRGG